MSVTASPAPSRPLSLSARLTYPAIILLGLLLLAGEVWHEWSTRQARITELQSSAANLARSLLKDAEGDFAMADTALVSLVEQLEAEGTEPASLAQAGRLMRRQLDNQPDLRNFTIYGQNGELLLTSYTHGASGISIADRSYFRAHREDPALGAQIGNAVRSRLDGQWVVTLSRRITDREGRFAGVVVAAIEVAALTRDFSGYALGRNGSIALLRLDSRLLARLPFDEAMLGSPVFNRFPFPETLVQRQSGEFQFASPLDGVERLGAYQAGERYPLVLVVGYDQQDALTGWRHRAALRGTVVVVLAALLMLLGHDLVQQARRRRQAEQVLAASETHFRLLTEHASDMVSRIGKDGRLRYVSPASTRLFGLPPRALLGRPVEELADQEDRELLRGTLAQAAEEPEGDVTCRITRPDGSRAWVETTFRRVEAAGDGEDSKGYIAVSRDVTERKMLELRMAELAATDGLTGLANRRRFDERLVLEWRRAAREGGWLSVLLLDVDHFKLFNDRYGHLAGDDALRAVAWAVDHAIRRPGDVAARYGGEEFAVILPGTDAAGAREVAERVRQAVASTGIRHEANEAGHVTASLGAAAVQPLPNAAPDPALLLRAADAALYEAKRNGRNRVAEAAPIAMIPARRTG